MSLLLLPATWNPIVLIPEKKVCLEVSDICCWSIFDAVEELFNKPSDELLSPFAL